MLQEECKGGDCPLRPQFDEPEGQAPASGDKKVRLSTSKYVQLLIDARETDPDCWPPGLEEAAGMIEQARAIEEECIAKWDEFNPDKLSREQGRKYFEIQLALDALQEEVDEAPLNLQKAISAARDSLDSDEAGHDGAEDTPMPPAHSSIGAGEPGGYALPAPPSPPLSDGFFARGLSEAEEFFIARADTPQAEDEAIQSFSIESSWPEVPPLQRGDNYA